MLIASDLAMFNGYLLLLCHWTFIFLDSLESKGIHPFLYTIPVTPFSTKFFKRAKFVEQHFVVFSAALSGVTYNNIIGWGVSQFGTECKAVFT